MDLFWTRWCWFARIPFKVAVFLFVVFAMSFPNPVRLVTHLRRAFDPSSVVDPGAVELEPLLTKVKSVIHASMSGDEVLAHVERAVYEAVPYEWDWNNWMNADYLPTVSEVFAKGKEDCDGRAVVAASILSRLGYRAELVSDMSHVWVRTEVGETMGPGKVQAMVATEEGVRVNPEVITQIPRSLAYGIAVFPLWREVIIVGVLWILLWRPGCRGARIFASLFFLLNGLIVLRLASTNYRSPQALGQWFGVFDLVLGWVIMAGASARAHSFLGRGYLSKARNPACSK